MSTEPQEVEEVVIKCEVIEISDETEEETPKKKKSESPRRRVTYAQLECLWSFLTKNKDFATGYNKTSYAREFSRRMWKEIAVALNAHGSGAVKDWKGWCKYWNDYKSKLKRLSAASVSAPEVTEGGQSTTKRPTYIEKKFLEILDNDSGSEMPGIRVEPFVEIQTETPVCTNTTTQPNSESTQYNSEHPGTQTEPSSRPVSPSQMPGSPQQSAVTSRRSQRRRNLTPQLAQPALLRRERGAVIARRGLKADSQRRIQMEEEKLELWRIMIEEIRDLKDILRQRIRKRSIPKERSKCDLCPKTFTTRYELKKHMRTHTGERPYMCTVCGKTYTQLGHLSIHKLSHEGIKNFNCSDCGSAFYRKADLDRHERIHLGIKPHVCEICSKSFTQKNNLVMHVKMHVGDRAHQCEVCSKRFMTRSKLTMHAKRHEKTKKVKNELGAIGNVLDCC